MINSAQTNGGFRFMHLRAALLTFTLMTPAMAIAQSDNLPLPPPGANAEAPKLTPPPPVLPVGTAARPSDEMDFTLAPVPQAHFTKPVKNSVGVQKPGTEGANATSDSSVSHGNRKGNAAGEYFDQFFSTATVMPPEQAALPEAQPVAPVPTPTATPSKKKKAKAPPPPSVYKFGTFKEPQPVYAKEYSQLNSHLPVAVFQSDLQNLLALAAMEGKIGDLRALSHGGGDIRQPTPAGESLVSLATRYNRVDAVRWLLQHGVPADQPDTTGLTPLHYAAYNNNRPIANLLLQYGASPTVTDPSGRTPIAIAESRGDNGTKALLQKSSPRG